MPYEYDIFISYHRQKFQDEWLTEHFLERFEYLVSEEIAGLCGRVSSGIFFDQREVNATIRTGTFRSGRGIEPGDNWRKALETAIKTSRCLVGLWSPMYFLSRWCRTEWRSFENRPKTPFVPLSVYDGKYFPVEAQAYQKIDLSDFVQVGKGLKDGEKSGEFQARVKLLAEAVALKVKDAPPFADWPVVQDPAPDPPDPTIPLTSLADAARSN
jgi:hypothetical protein